jgi:hypothetical protein
MVDNRWFKKAGAISSYEGSEEDKTGRWKEFGMQMAKRLLEQVKCVNR